jgi:hypothetical protein
MECMMPKNSSPDRANINKRAADRLFWLTVLSGVVSMPVTWWLFYAAGMLDSMPREAAVFMMVVCLVAWLAFIFTHRKADGTIQWDRPAKKATSTPKPPQGRKTLLLLATIFSLDWLLANVLHLSEGMLSLVKIVSGAAVAVLCARYVLRSQKPGSGVD